MFSSGSKIPSAKISITDTSNPLKSLLSHARPPGLILGGQCWWVENTSEPGEARAEPGAARSVAAGCQHVTVAPDPHCSRSPLVSCPGHRLLIGRHHHSSHCLSQGEQSWMTGPAESELNQRRRIGRFCPQLCARLFSDEVRSSATKCFEILTKVIKHY